VILFHSRFIMWNLVRIRPEDRRRWRPTRSRCGRPAVRAPRPRTGPAGPDRKTDDLSDFPGGRSPRRTGRWGRGRKAAPTPRRRRTGVVHHRGGPTRPTRRLTDISRHPQIPSQVGCIYSIVQVHNPGTKCYFTCKEIYCTIQVKNRV
jgi:hypothetical protein